MTAKPSGFSGIECVFTSYARDRREKPGAVRTLAKPERRYQNLLRGGRIVTCREFADFIADYLSNELPAKVRTAFDDHLRVCSNCRKYLTSYEETVKLGKRAFEDEDAVLPPEVP